MTAMRFHFSVFSFQLSEVLFKERLELFTAQTCGNYVVVLIEDEQRGNTADAVETYCLAIPTLEG